MNRREFLKNSLLAAISISIFPKDLLSNTSEKPDELMEFAKYFSESYNILSTGTYKSNRSKYTIDYVDKIVDEHNNEELNSPYRVNTSTGVMQFSKSKIKHYKKSYVFQGIIWCHFSFLNKGDLIKSDIESLQIALENGFSKKELLAQNLKCFSSSPSEFNKIRLHRIINNYESTKNT